MVQGLLNGVYADKFQRNGIALRLNYVRADNQPVAKQYMLGTSERPVKRTVISIMWNLKVTYSSSNINRDKKL